MRDDHERLEDIREAIDRIEKYASKGCRMFETDELIQTWILHHLQIIGEASRCLTVEFREQHPEFPLKETVGLRNILVHHYFGIDKKAVWLVVEKELPALKKCVEAILTESDAS